MTWTRDSDRLTTIHHTVSTEKLLFAREPLEFCLLCFLLVFMQMLLKRAMAKLSVRA